MSEHNENDAVVSLDLPLARREGMSLTQLFCSSALPCSFFYLLFSFARFARAYEQMSDDPHVKTLRREVYTEVRPGLTMAQGGEGDGCREFREASLKGCRFRRDRMQVARVLIQPSFPHNAHAQFH